MDRADYFQEAIECSLADMGAEGALTPEQIQILAGDIEGAYSCMSMAFGDDVASANVTVMHEREKADLRRAVQREQDKVHCRQCNGKGRIVAYFGTFQSDSECSKCRGEGRHDP